MSKFTSEKAGKKTSIASKDKSKTSVKQNVNKKTGPKPGEEIKGIFRNRRKLEETILGNHYLSIQ